MDIFEILLQRNAEKNAFYYHWFIFFFKGVNLKGANLEGSNMAGVNLRVATLKGANLQNCDLRAAVFAGADLQVHVLYHCLLYP